MTNTSKVLYIDIETAPMIAAVWGRWGVNIASNQILEDWHMLSFSYAWGDEEPTVIALNDFKKPYKKNPQCDKELCKILWELLNRAEVVVGHNGDAFDIKKIQTRLIINGFTPPMSFKSEDTLKMAKKHFKFTSNKLDDIGEYLGVGRKLPNAGMALWLGVMAGDLKRWQEMKDYNKQDVILLRNVHKVVSGWYANSINLIQDPNTPTCPRATCGSTNLRKNGAKYTTRAGVSYESYKCKDCGGHCRARVNVNSGASQLPLRVLDRK